MKRKKIYYICNVLLLFILVIGIKGLLREKAYHINIPIRFGSAGIPLLEVEIQDKKYSIEMDLGSKFQLSLNREIINQLNKKPYGTLVRKDIKGRAYEVSTYRIRSVQIEDISFSNVKIGEENDDFIGNATFWVNPDRDPKDFDRGFGTIGRPLLTKRNLLLDFQRSLFFMTNDQKKLKKEGYELEELEKIPLETGKRGAILLVTTDFGKLRLVIDTGSTASLVRTSFLPREQSIAGKKYDLPFVTTSEFVIGKKDFGPMNLCLMDITPELHEFDGILGMDFLKRHIIYLDYAKKTAYFGKSS